MNIGNEHYWLAGLRYKSNSGYPIGIGEPGGIFGNHPGINYEYPKNPGNLSLKRSAYSFSAKAMWGLHIGWSYKAN